MAKTMRTVKGRRVKECDSKRRVRDGGNVRFDAPSPDKVAEDTATLIAWLKDEHRVMLDEPIVGAL
jgi:hypothetical protein